MAAVPLMMAHGNADPMILLDSAEQSAKYLRSLGIDVDFRHYPMGHEVCLNEIRDISAWLGRIQSR